MKDDDPVDDALERALAEALLAEEDPTRGREVDANDLAGLRDGGVLEEERPYLDDAIAASSEARDVLRALGPDPPLRALPAPRPAWGGIVAAAAVVLLWVSAGIGGSSTGDVGASFAFERDELFRTSRNVTSGELWFLGARLPHKLYVRSFAELQDGSVLPMPLNMLGELTLRLEEGEHEFGPYPLTIESQGEAQKVTRVLLVTRGGAWTRGEVESLNRSLARSRDRAGAAEILERKLGGTVRAVAVP